MLASTATGALWMPMGNPANAFRTDFQVVERGTVLLPTTNEIDFVADNALLMGECCLVWCAVVYCGVLWWVCRQRLANSARVLKISSKYQCSIFVADYDQSNWLMILFQSLAFGITVVMLIVALWCDVKSREAVVELETER